MMVRSLAPVLAAVHCISYAAVVVSAESMSDDPFDEEPVTAAPVSDDPPELQAFQSYMGYMNKAVPMLAIVLFIMIYVFTTYINPEKKPPRGPKVHVSHILVEQEAEADAIRKEIKSASKKTLKFAELAAKKSNCPSKSKGGHMGVFGKGQMLPEFEKIVFTEPVGSVHVVRTKFGWHVIMIAKREDPVGDLKRKKH